MAGHLLLHLGHCPEMHVPPLAHSSRAEERHLEQSLPRPSGGEAELGQLLRLEANYPTELRSATFPPI